MLQITKQGNSIVVEGLNHYFYPYNGTLEVPCNSVITVVDEGDIVLFRSASNYDVLFSAKVDEITINGQSVTKDNVGEVFGALSNVSSGGGGLTPEQEEKLNNAVQISVYNADKATQTTIDEAQNTEINKVKGDIEGKQDIIQDLNAIREGADLGKTALQEETDPIWTTEKGNYYTKTESDSIYATQVVVNEEIAARINDVRDVKATLESKADKSEIPNLNGYATEQWVGQQGYLTEHQQLKTINGETIVGNGNIEIASGEETDPIWNAEKGNYYTKTEINSSLESKADKTEIPSLDNYYTKTEVNASLETKANKSEIPSLNGYATEQWVGQQGYLTEHQPLKTINGETIVGNGDIVISSGEETDPIWNAEKVNYYTKTEVNTSLESKANKSEIPSLNGYATEQWVGQQGYLTEHQSLDNYYTKTEVNTSLESKADKTEIPSLNGYATEQWVGQQGYLTEHQTLKTINGESIIGSGDIVISGGGEETDPVWTAEKGNYYTKTEIDGIVGNVNNALSEIING